MCLASEYENDHGQARRCARRVVYRKNLLGVRRKMVGLGFPSRGRRICLSGPHSRHSGPSAPPYRFGPADRSVEILRFWHASRDPNSLTMGGAHQLQCRRPSSSVPESLDLNYAYAGVEAVEYENRSLHQDSLTSPAAYLSTQSRKGFEKLDPLDESDSELLGGCRIVLCDISNDFVEIPLSFGSQDYLIAHLARNRCRTSSSGIPFPA